jgi:hypothetical protein
MEIRGSTVVENSAHHAKVWGLSPDTVLAQTGREIMAERMKWIKKFRLTKCFFWNEKFQMNISH